MDDIIKFLKKNNPVFKRAIKQYPKSLDFNDLILRLSETQEKFNVDTTQIPVDYVEEDGFPLGYVIYLIKNDEYALSTSQYDSLLKLGVIKNKQKDEEETMVYDINGIKETISEKIETLQESKLKILNLDNDVKKLKRMMAIEEDKHKYLVLSNKKHGIEWKVLSYKGDFNNGQSVLIKNIEMGLIYCDRENERINISVGKNQKTEETQQELENIADLKDWLLEQKNNEILKPFKTSVEFFFEPSNK